MDANAAISMAYATNSSPKTATPPADAARGATADLCDVFIPEAVDVISQRKVQIVEPIFRCLFAIDQQRPAVCLPFTGKR